MATLIIAELDHSKPVSTTLTPVPVQSPLRIIGEEGRESKSA